ncbi:expressed unknown protein [Seminavis robusta]|uniref:Uncharacterized protein n=1 Tax=Seminavis robusta TaxID=568900 RepID=A0A9N8HV81_9STRA|nr:expressed unknown protein [Seminavis robusta]|eukprot:Sro1894_g303920.1 n/a (283) ;mRNA; r:4167-5168
MAPRSHPAQKRGSSSMTEDATLFTYSYTVDGTRVATPSTRRRLTDAGTIDSASVYLATVVVDDNQPAAEEAQAEDPEMDWTEFASQESLNAVDVDDYSSQEEDDEEDRSLTYCTPYLALNNNNKKKQQPTRPSLNGLRPSLRYNATNNNNEDYSDTETTAQEDSSYASSFASSRASSFYDSCGSIASFFTRRPKTTKTKTKNKKKIGTNLRSMFGSSSASSSSCRRRQQENKSPSKRHGKGKGRILGKLLSRSKKQQPNNNNRDKKRDPLLRNTANTLVIDV